MLGMGFEPMNFAVSNLKFDALDRSANLTYEKNDCGVIACFFRARLIVIAFYKKTLEICDSLRGDRCCIEFYC